MPPCWPRLTTGLPTPRASRFLPLNLRGTRIYWITCVVTALLKVTRRRFAARFRARFRAFFLDPGIQPLPVPDPAPHGSAPRAAAALLLPLLSGPRYTQPPSYPYC